ncbi:efflux RND transporter periplasmic adaptor subunit [Saccharicrinis fermentans]|uniref:efflux RND transporter periplasmic adaptor subunit n=1 Tax=Saccharicrinis fermentans TaxID=982 RepID=UPI0004AF60FE|nr:efflux RND transporter periplasmic adaptor subunit [Saccharicrinis fermentans]
MKNLIKNTILTILIMTASACGSSVDKPTELAAYKKQMTELKKKISSLENQLQAEEGTSANVVNVTADIIRPKTYDHYIEVTGKVKADENTIISPEGAGKITQLLVEEGDKVRKGQVLAYLNTDAIESQIMQAKAGVELAVTTYNRQKNLWDQHIGSEIEYLQAKSNKESQEQNLKALQAQLAMSTVKSQIEGIVDEVFQKKGEIAGPAIPFARIVNIDDIYINAEVGESYLGQINKGDTTTVYFPALKKTVDATIFRSSMIINDISRTFRVRINLKNTDHVIKPNLISVVKLKVYKAKDVLIVPSILVKQDFKGEFIFIAEVKDGKTWAKKQYVQSVFNSDNKSIIKEGLKDGDAIITQGYDQIVNGTEISIVNH